jgi:hypothetical protein
MKLHLTDMAQYLLILVNLEGGFDNVCKAKEDTLDESSKIGIRLGN